MKQQREKLYGMVSGELELNRNIYFLFVYIFVADIHPE